MQMLLPLDQLKFDSIIYPYKKCVTARVAFTQTCSFHNRSHVKYLTNDKYCDECLKRLGPYAHGRQLLFVIDIAIIDFLIGAFCVSIQFTHLL
jgi:hypothetical protein